MELAGLRVALSLSLGHDIAEYGLAEDDLFSLGAEIVGKIVDAGGVIVFCGRLTDDGVTWAIADEARRRAGERVAFELLVPEIEYERHPITALHDIQARLGKTGKLVLVSSVGTAFTLDGPRFSVHDIDAASALTALRQLVARTTHSRVAVGGRATPGPNLEPGVVEECRLSLTRGAAVVAVGGYGGVSHTVGRTLYPDDYPRPSSTPLDFAIVGDAFVHALRTHGACASAVADGWGKSTRAALAHSRDPTVVAQAVMTALSKAPRTPTND